MLKSIQFLLLAFFVSVTFSVYHFANGVIEKNNTKYISNTVVVKFKGASSAGFNKTVNLSAAVLSVMNPYQVLTAKPYLSFTAKHKNSFNNIVVIEYGSSIDPLLLASKLKNLDEVEWAEPKYLREVSYTPNDPGLINQYALTKINAAGAWDISHGDTSVIIGIVDTGVDWDHPDLAANIWINKGEIPGDGIDNDGNGFIDDVRGWDFGGLTGEHDNNPMEDGAYHGTHVAGIASAVSDNGTGVASIGFNCKIMPVKAAQDNLKNSSGQPYISHGNVAIIYAVDNGARIINCSYGGSGYSLLDQETVNYAVANNVLIVAAAGNDNVSDPHYPSAYEGVLSVASTDLNDKKSYFSNYGTTVDVSAPGSGIYSTWQNDTYDIKSGTSMASPLATGLAALVASHFPLYSPGQIAEQIRVNTDNIDNLNSAYTMMLGSGRINAYKALSNNNSIAVRAVDIQYSDAAPGGNNNGILEAGEIISIGIKFVNYLTATSGLSVTLQSMNANAVIQNGSLSAGVIAPLDSFDNYSARFTALLPDSIEMDAELLFTLNYNDGSYSDFQLFNTRANPTYRTQSGNNISLTITSSGNLAFNDYPTNLGGTGFHYLDGGNIMFEGALILGTSAVNISDAARNHTGNERNDDFKIVEPFRLSIPGEQAEQQGITVFNDDNAGSNKLGVTVTLNSYSFSEDEYNNSILLDYGITNNSGSEITGLYAGLYIDWDMVEGSGADDVTSFDEDGKFAYAYHPGGNPDNYAGAAVVEPALYNFRAIMNDGSDGGFQVYDGFTDSEKWQSISGGISRPSAGPGDISHVVAAGPVSVAAGETKNIVFALGAALNLEALSTVMTNARNKYNNLTDTGGHTETPASYSLSQNYPNPFNPGTLILYSVAEPGMVTLKIYDILGKEVASLVNEQKEKGKYEVNFNGENLASGIYFYELRSGSYVQSKKMILLR
jgi:serine protease